MSEGSCGPRVISRRRMVLLIGLLALAQANWLAYWHMTRPGGLQLHAALSAELTRSAKAVVLQALMAVEAVAVLAVAWAGWRPALRGARRCAFWGTAAVAVAEVVVYCGVALEQRRFEGAMHACGGGGGGGDGSGGGGGGDGVGGLCQFDHYFPSWLMYPLPAVQTVAAWLLGEPMWEPHEPTFARLEWEGQRGDAGVSEAERRGGRGDLDRRRQRLSFPGCPAHRHPAYNLHPAKVLLTEADVPPVGSGKGDQSASNNGLMESLLGVSANTQDSVNRFRRSSATNFVPTGGGGVLIDDDDDDDEENQQGRTTAPVGLVQAFCDASSSSSSSSAPRVEETILPHVPEIPRLRKQAQQTAAGTTTTSSSSSSSSSAAAAAAAQCPYSLTVVLVDSMSLARAKRIWPQFWAELREIDPAGTAGAFRGAGGGSGLRAAGDKKQHQQPAPSTDSGGKGGKGGIKGGASVFNFVRYNAVGAGDKQFHVSTGFNVQPMFTGRPHVSHKDPRPPNQTAFFWEEMRARHGFASYWANGMCSNYGSYFGRARMWTDVELDGPGCHPDYDPEGGQTNNFKGPYSIFPRFVAGTHVHRHLLRYPAAWRARYGGPAALPTVGIVNLLEA